MIRIFEAHEEKMTQRGRIMMMIEELLPDYVQFDDERISRITDMLKSEFVNIDTEELMKCLYSSLRFNRTSIEAFIEKHLD